MHCGFFIVVEEFGGGGGVLGVALLIG